MHQAPRMRPQTTDLDIPDPPPGPPGGGGGPRPKLKIILSTARTTTELGVQFRWHSSPLLRATPGRCVADSSNDLPKRYLERNGTRRSLSWTLVHKQKPSRPVMHQLWTMVLRPGAAGKESNTVSGQHSAMLMFFSPGCAYDDF